MTEVAGGITGEDVRVADRTQSPQDSTLRIDVLGAIIRYWRFIAFWTVVATILAAFLSSLLPRTYMATACLLINPSPYKTSSLEQPPLDVDVYDRMLRSAALVKKVRDQVGLKDVTVERLRSKMQVRLIKRPSVRETTYAPLLVLQVEDQDPRKCQQLANTWAELATSTSLRIKSAVIERDKDRIRTQFNETKRLLEQKEDELARFDMTARLVERKAELEMLRKQLTSEQGNLERLRRELSVAQTRLDDLKRKYESFFVGGIWVGTLYQADGDTSALLDATAVEPLARQLLLARNNLVKKSRELARFKIQQGVEILKHRYDVVRDKIERIERERADAHLTLAGEKAKLADLERRQKTIPQRLIVAKAITEEALWKALVDRPEKLDDLTSTRLVSEQINPLWLSTQGRLHYVRSQATELEARLGSYEALLKQLRAEEAKLDSLVETCDRQVQNLETEVELAEDRYEALFQIFLRISYDIAVQESTVARLREEIANSQRQVDRLTSAVSELNNYTVAKELERERLQRELTSVKNIYTSLATKYEEARVTELEVSGDLQIALRAALPEEKIKPKRSAVVSVTFLCALILFSGLAVLREYVGRQVARSA